jgi:L-2-hydroxyglutarate oxidase LhgO
VVVGGGLIGLAAAWQLTRTLPGAKVVVLEKEREFGLHQSGRNSCVIHSGIYYAPGSLKAQLCAEGRSSLFEFCDRHGIPYELCGKVVVATSSSELARLERLRDRGSANGAEGLRLIGQGELAEIEPHCRAIAALHVPSAGLVDYGAVLRALVRDVEASGGLVVTGAEVRSFDRRPGGLTVRTSVGAIESKIAVACAGVHADRLVSPDGSFRHDYSVVPFRGSYYAFAPSARAYCRNLIYPAPDPRFPFLGVHVSRRPDGEVWAGPNAVLARGRESYDGRLVVGDMLDTVRSKGFRRMARRYWRTGLAEQYRDLVKRSFVRAVTRYLPDVTPDDLVAAPAGIRAQAVARKGTLVDDFLFVHEDRVLHVANAPSPGATSSLAIGRVVAERALDSGLGR